jgi:hypothetical protein
MLENFLPFEQGNRFHPRQLLLMCLQLLRVFLGQLG